MTITVPEFAKHEFSRPWEVSRLNTMVKLTATPEECAAVAKRLGLLGIESLTGEVRLSAGRGKTTIAKGRFQASVSQECVVTLDPVPAMLNEEFEDLYGDDEGTTSYDEETAADQPDPVINGQVDLGELLVQHLSLSLDPYPRKEGVEFKGYEIG